MLKRRYDRILHHTGTGVHTADKLAELFERSKIAFGVRLRSTWHDGRNRINHKVILSQIVIARQASERTTLRRGRGGSPRVAATCRD